MLYGRILASNWSHSRRRRKAASRFSTQLEVVLSFGRETIEALWLSLRRWNDFVLLVEVRVFLVVFLHFKTRG